MLSDPELVDCAATTDPLAAIAHRPLRPSVLAPIATTPAPNKLILKTLISLAVNPGAELLEFYIRRMIERHGHDAGLRDELLARPNLSAALGSDLAGAAAKALYCLINWLQQIF